MPTFCERIARFGLKVSTTAEGKTRIEGLALLPESDRVEVLAIVELEKALRVDTELARKLWGECPPLIAQDMPDWRAFCANYPLCEELGCCYYDGDSISWCILWENAFPNKVSWYPY